MIKSRLWVPECWVFPCQWQTVPAQTEPSYPPACMQIIFHSVVHSLSSTLIHSFARSFIHSFNHLLIHSFDHSLIHPSILPSIHSSFHLFMYCLMHIELDWVGLGWVGVACPYHQGWPCLASSWCWASCWQKLTRYAANKDDKVMVTSRINWVNEWVNLNEWIFNIMTSTDWLWLRQPSSTETAILAGGEVHGSLCNAVDERFRSRPSKLGLIHTDNRADLIAASIHACTHWFTYSHIHTHTLIQTWTSRTLGLKVWALMYQAIFPFCLPLRVIYITDEQQTVHDECCKLS